MRRAGKIRNPAGEAVEVDFTPQQAIRAWHTYVVELSEWFYAHPGRSEQRRQAGERLRLMRARKAIV